MRAPSTERLYAAAQDEFRIWCRAQGLRFPVSHPDVAEYLQLCAKLRGPASVRIHRAAIARLYRDKGLPLDPKVL